MCISKIISNNAVKNIVAASVVAGIATGITLAVNKSKKNITDASNKPAEILGRSQVKQPDSDTIKGIATHSGKEYTAKVVNGGIEGEIGGVKYSLHDLLGQGFILQTYANGKIASEIDIKEDGKAFSCSTRNSDGQYDTTQM